MTNTIEEKAAKRATLEHALPEESQMRKFIGSRIRKIRKEYFVTQIELANTLGCSSATAVAFWESGERSINAAKLEKIAQHFNVPLSYFSPSEPNPTPQ